MALWIPFALLVVGAASIFLEIFIPAGGLIGVAGAICIVVAVVVGFIEHGVGIGSLILLSAVIAVPLIIVLGLRVFPRTWIGKRLILGYRHGDDSAGASGHAADGASDPGEPPAVAVGSEGSALTDLRPSGMARIDGRKYSVVTSGEYLDRDSPLRVIRSEGSRIVVRRTESPAQENSQQENNQKE